VIKKLIINFFYLINKNNIDYIKIFYNLLKILKKYSEYQFILNNNYILIKIINIIFKILKFVFLLLKIF